ncbi:MAG TPA: tetratricopeptide repeat protein [Acidobacteriota bacterium]
MKGTLFRAASFSVLLFVVFAGSLQAQSSQSRLRTLQGYVKSDREVPGQIIIQLVQITGPVFDQRTVSASGSFLFNRVPVGNYLLVINHQGFEPVQQPVEVGGLYNSTIDVVVFMKSKEAATVNANAAPAGNVSVRQIKIDPRANVEYMAARDQMKRAKVEKALPHLYKAIQIEPNFVEALNDLSYYLILQKNYSEAEDYLQRALAVNPRSSHVLANLGLSRLEQKRYSEAAEFLSRAISENPHEAQIRMDLATALFHRRRWNEAIAEYRNALQLKPGAFVEARLFIAEALFQSGERQKAAAEIEIFLAENPNSPHRERAKQFLELTRAGDRR